MKKVLIWGRHGNYGPDYPRNRVIEAVLRSLGCELSRFLPRLSATADLEYMLRRGARPDLVWVPCFRQRDLAAAARYARRQRIPLVFDPLISAYDKQVNEKHKFAADSARARKLLAWESRLFQLPDWLIADTAGHADYFHATHGVARARIRVVPVGAEEALFTPQPWPPKPADGALELAFFGTFIGLQGVDVLAQAILHYDGPPTHWRLIGEGPLKAECERVLAPLVGTNGPSRVSFEGWGPLPELPGRLASVDAILGIFGRSDKALRVIPNKVYQGLAIGRAVITAATPAFVPELRADEAHGLLWAKPGDARSLCAAVTRLHQRRAALQALGEAARRTYERHYSNDVIRAVLAALIAADGHNNTA
ncbi:glycosyltransferase [Thauera sp.]|jgi:glycosyltransferase involved in cell wall biosynthesis|uniref:glycosyltransferase n=1 Tax=Thauera sp. TaxID=1905334 RepID=UPI00260423D9|nr:glycosyltransferase [Thauera sp.]MCK6408210.1 glycosyltransferase [Thauera sp.]